MTPLSLLLLIVQQADPQQLQAVFDVKHTYGILSMAWGEAMDSARTKDRGGRNRKPRPKERVDIYRMRVVRKN